MECPSAGYRMAEYVRRKRPPASHPYWARLHDRAHPPKLVTPIAVPAVCGVFFGFVGGLQPAFSAAEAARLSAAVAGILAGAAFVLSATILWAEQSSRLPRWAPITAALSWATCWALVVFA